MNNVSLAAAALDLSKVIVLMHVQWHVCVHCPVAQNRLLAKIMCSLPFDLLAKVPARCVPQLQLECLATGAPSALLCSRSATKVWHSSAAGHKLCLPCGEPPATQVQAQEMQECLLRWLSVDVLPK